MAVTVARGSAEALNLGSSPVSGYPISMACWFKTPNQSNEQALISVADSSVASQMHTLSADGSHASNLIRARSRDGLDNESAATGAGYSSDVWTHACAVFTNATLRGAYINGGNVGFDVQSSDPSGFDQTRLGSTANATPAQFHDGEIAEAGIWDVALVAAEVASLGKGYSPLLIRPAGLVFYASLIRDVAAGSWPERIGGTALSEVNTPTVDVHPPMFYPSIPAIWLATAAAAGISIPVVQHHRQRNF